MGEPVYLLDTNVCIYLLNARYPALAERVARCDQGTLVTSAIVFAEVMIGATQADASQRAAALFGMISPLPFDRAAGESYARLPFRRGNLDRLIAAHALALDLTLVTNDARHFADIPDLRVENWTLPA